MKNGTTIIYLNPDLLRNEFSFSILKNFLLSSVEVSSNSMFVGISDSEELIVEPLLENELASLSFTEFLEICKGYWKMTLESLSDYVGI